MTARPTEKPARRRGELWGRLLAATLVLLAVIAFAISRAGHWLMVSEPLAPADAVVVLTGHLPVRAMEAARILKDADVNEVWLTRGSDRRTEVQILARFGIVPPHEDDYSRQILERLEVPKERIRLIAGRPRNTVEEVKAISEEMDRSASRRVILVTSKAHSRRVRVTWDRIVGPEREVIVRYAEGDLFDPDRWWATTESGLDVLRECFGLANAWLGFPVKPRES